MSHILVRKMVDQTNRFAGRDWWYDFRSLKKTFDEKRFGKYAQDLAQLFSKKTKQWDDDLNSEWLCRVFLSARMVLSASVMLQGLEFAKRKNLRIVVDYLEYYAILTALRTVVFTSPIVGWEGGEIIRQTHKKTINVACDILARIDKKYAKKISECVLYMKAYRELISYRAPSSGGSFKKERFHVDADELCQVLVEIAQAQSEILEASISKNVTGQYVLLESYFRETCESVIEGYSFYDEEDAYRLNYLERKYPSPTNILHIMSEGHVEDFFGSWCPKDGVSGDVFDPDDNWRIIFDVP